MIGLKALVELMIEGKATIEMIIDVMQVNNCDEKQVLKQIAAMSYERIRLIESQDMKWPESE